MAREKRTNEVYSESSRIDRRSYLKGLGVAAASVAGVGAFGSSSQAAEYQTLKVAPGAIEQIYVDSGETVENLLIDMRAQGAEGRIVARGNDWTIRNVGWLGATDNDGGVPNMISARGNGLIDSCFIGNGVSMAVSREGAIGVPRGHTGSLRIENTFIGGWTDNGVYAGGVAEGGGGEIHVDNCYCLNNNIAHLRIASDGSTITNTTIVNDEPIPRGGHGTNTRGIWDGYGDLGQTVHVENCHIDSTGTPTTNSALVAGSVRFDVRDCEVRGRILGNVETTNVGDAPDTSVPAGVPTTAIEASSGDLSGGGGSGSGDSGSDLPNTLSISGGTASNKTAYRFSVTDAIQKSTARQASIDPEDSIQDGDVEGIVAGGTDSYDFAGEVVGFDVDGDATVYLNDQQVDPTSFGGGDGSGGESLPNVVVIDGSNVPGQATRYTFEVSGEVEKDPERGSINSYDEIDGSTVTGRVIGGKDAYGYSGNITRFSLDGPAIISIEDVDSANGE